MTTYTTNLGNHTPEENLKSLAGINEILLSEGVNKDGSIVLAFVIIWCKYGKLSYEGYTIEWEHRYMGTEVTWTVQ